MGAWGTGISSNDEYSDVYGDIMEEFNKGTPIQKVIDDIIKKYEGDYSDDINTINNMYFASAFSEWECGVINGRSYYKVKDIIESGDDLECWRELGASDGDIKKREKALKSFLEKISIPKEKPKKPKQIKFKPAIFEKGDVLSLHLDDGSFTGAIILENLKSSDEFGSNFVIKAYMSKNERPTIDEILKAKVYSYTWCLGVHYKKYIKQIEVIGKVPIKFEYDDKGIGTTHAGWSFIVMPIRENDYNVKENQEIRSISDFLSMTPKQIANIQEERVKKHFRGLSKNK